MAKCKDFTNFKERGEWVEAQFIAQALRMGFKVLKPWGDSSAYDIGVEYGRQFFRMQVKSTSYRLGSGYLCGFKPNRSSRVKYTTKTVDFFAAYVIPQNAWYVLPSYIVLKTKSQDLMLCPVRQPKRDLYHYESYREAWNLMRRPSQRT
ncbi:MAG: group I intron-associated PD-(D/E)XK endonuclease [Candidatus Sulfotelmatobacter sp.]